tara:strand:+ start:48 stop:1151 length:1104 start_codon:yes stop_codon:yes gene_type:complete
MKELIPNFTPLTANIEDLASWTNGKVNTDVINPSKYCKENNLSNRSIPINYEYWNENIVKVVKNYEEILIDSGNLTFYRLGELAKENNIKVVLAGNGGDELFGGYPWQEKVLRLNPLFRKSFKFSKKTFNLIENILINLNDSYLRNRAIRAFQLYLSPSYYHATSLSSTFVPDVVRDGKSSNLKLRYLAEKNFSNINSNEIDWGNRVNISNFFSVIPSQNYKADMGSMSSSVENRAPFLDFRLVEYMLSVPHEEKVKFGHKSLLRKVSRNYLPKYISNAKKSGPTVPLNAWFEGENSKRTKNFLVSNKELIMDFLGANFANKWFSEDRLSNDNNNGLARFALINLILWLKINYSNEQIDDNCVFSEI